jgi:protein-S-isoprenylcysteine O-methyltransferase Ste14
MRVRQRWRVGGRPGLDRSAMVLAACAAGALFAAVRLGRDGPLVWPGSRVWPVIVGLALVGVGVGLRAWSIATLGHFFQYRIEVQADHEVITGGPYR